MTTLQQLRIAERDNDWVKVKLCLLRLGLTKSFGDPRCPHCAGVHVGRGAWPYGMSNKDWAQLVNVYEKGYIYRCSCTNLYLFLCPSQYFHMS